MFIGLFSREYHSGATGITIAQPAFKGRGEHRFESTCANLRVAAYPHSTYQWNAHLADLTSW